MDIAIIGISLRLPNKINSLDDLYFNLANKNDCIENHPNDRFNTDSYYSEKNSKTKFCTKKGGYLRDIFNFDNDFFNISNKEARSMDPQQRILLELVYESIKDANLEINDLSNTNTGVFVGSCNIEYFSNQIEDTDLCNEYSITGGLLTLLSNRISYFYNLKGPSMTIDTACSSSSYALHHACNSIKSGDCEMCFVGGSNLILNPETIVGFSQGKFLSPDGKCKSFDCSADGYVRSEGCVVLLIKSLEKAIIDNNNIYAVIKETNINQDGKTNSITMPNQIQQEKLLSKSYTNYNLDDLVYIEAHGTGTKIGDKIEASSLGNSIGKFKKEKLNIGSIKSNIGHTEATSGLASICKIILMMKYKQLLPNLHFSKQPQDINLNALNLKVVTEIEQIKKNKFLIGINNYGFGGANFHCVLENYIQNNTKQSNSYEKKNNLHLLCIYGSNQQSIDKNITQFLNYDDEDFLKYLYNQNNYYKHNEAKIFIVKDKKDFCKNLFAPQQNQKLNYIYGSFKNNKPNICFVFCGQGPQYLEMGTNLMENFPTFKNKILECDKIWKKITNFSFIEKYKIFSSLKNENIQINDPIIAQPAITFFQIALVDLYKHFNILPKIIIGHSAGELASFYTAGIMSLYDTIRISYYRSLLQQKTAGMGNMLAISQPVKKANEYIIQNPKLELAAINSNNSFVLAGPTNCITNLKNELKNKNILCTIIKGRCPFHSSYQEIIKDDILNKTKKINYENPLIKLISTVTGHSLDKNFNYKNYWWKNIRNIVQFNDSLNECSNIDIFIEISPHNVLEMSIKDKFPDKLVLQSANRKLDSSRIFLSTIAKLYFSGINIKNNFGIENNTHFPKYIWNKKCLIQKSKLTSNRHLGLINKLNIISFNYLKEEYIKDHVIQGKVILPTVTYIDLINRYILKENNCILNFNINDIFVVKDKFVNFSVENNPNNISFINEKKTYLTFSISNEKNNKFYFLEEAKDILASNFFLEKSQLISILEKKSFEFGSSFHCFKKAYIRQNKILLELPVKKNNLYSIYPPIIDTCLTSSVFIQGISNSIQYLPSKIHKIIYFNKSKIAKYCFGEIIYQDNKKLIGNSFLLDNEFNVILKLEKITSFSIDNNEAKIYNVNLLPIKLDEQKKTIHNYESLPNNLESIKNILLKNNKKIYLFDYNKNYEVIGFIRSFINELNEINFKICYHKNELKQLINNINLFKLTDIEYFFYNNTFNLMKLDNFDYSLKKFNNYFLYYESRGNINNLRFKNKVLPELKTGEILIENKSSALNFKDISVIYNLIPDSNIGYEFSGVVVETKSSKFKPGDKVFSVGLDVNGICNYTIVSEENTFLNPNNLDFNMSASIAISYGTAYLALIKYANIKQSDIVLIHSATGGLGLAAIEICKFIGCKVIATASTDNKRSYLKSIDNVIYVTDSRCYETYKNDILEFTNKKGVDVILASTINQFMETNLSLLKSGGKYVDVGKRQIYENHKIPCKYFIKSIQFHSVHFDNLINENRPLIKEVIEEVIGLFNDNKLKPIPLEIFDINQFKDAFKMLSKSQHIGKIILSISNDFKPTNCIPPDKFLNKDKYYLVTGGMGGLGLKLIKWLRDNGANKIIVTTRGNDTLENVITIKNNLLDYDKLSIELSKYDIDGVFHLAGSINDKFVKNLNKSELNIINSVKIKGIKNLGKYFEGKSHTYFVAFSSLVSLLGNPGQSIYSAENSFMDEYCKIRKLKGYPALSINLGAIGGVGIIHKDFNLANTMITNGYNFTPYYSFFEKFKYCLLEQNISNICITNQNWNNLKKFNYTIPFNHYFTSEDNSNFIAKDAESKLVSFIKYLLEIDDIDKDKNLISYGVDSIMSMEISNFCIYKLNIKIRQIDVLQGISINKILLYNISKFD